MRRSELAIVVVVAVKNELQSGERRAGNCGVGAHRVSIIDGSYVNNTKHGRCDDQAEVSLRGYDQPYSQRVLVLINGRQVHADDYSFTLWRALPVELSAICQIERVKGLSSALS